MTKFSDLNLAPKVLKAVVEAGYESPTPIQAGAIPPALEGRDVLGIAQTGTGKTASFTLPLITMLARGRARARMPRSLVLCPTRELAAQVAENFDTYAKHVKLTKALLIGGVSFKEQDTLIDKGVDVLIATPGRLLDHFERGKLILNDVKVMVVDEADRMLDMGFSPVVNQIAAEARWRKQTMLFSATLEGGGIARFSDELLNEPVELEADSSRKEKGIIHQWIHLADNASHKLDLLIHILSTQVETAIVFVKTRERLATLVGQLQAVDIDCVWLQGEMPQDKRNTAMERFRTGEVKILVATDVAARGIDVENISHVINYDMPRTADVYVHRIGRTGRAGNKGTAISIVEAHDIGVVPKIERYTEQPLKRRVIAALRPANKEAKAPTKKKVSNKTKKAVIKAKRTAKIKKRKNKGRGKKTP